MTYEEGLALCGELQGVEVIWIDTDGRLLTTSGIGDISADKKA
jgi:hypothetical protein